MFEVDHGLDVNDGMNCPIFDHFGINCYIVACCYVSADNNMDIK